MKSFSSLRLAALPLALSAVLPALAQSQLAPVVVTATRVEQPLTDVVADVSLIEREQIERSGATGLADLLVRIPGVEFTRNGGPGATTSLYLRGAETRFTAVYLDGVRVDSQSTGGAPWEAIPLAQIDRIEVLRGPAGAVYGSDALAGVVQIFTRKGEGAFSPYVGFGIGSQQTRKLDAGFSGASGAFDYSLGVSREISAGFNAKAASNPDRDGYRNRSASARLGLQIDAAHRVEATLLDSRVDAQYDATPYNAAKPQDDHSLHELRSAGLSWLARWNDAWRTRVAVSQGRDRYETLPSPYLTDTRVRSYLWHNELRHGAHLLTAALERREDLLENATTTPVATQRSQNALALGYGLKDGAHALQLNARHDDDSEFGGKATGSAAYGYGFAPGWRATASAANAFRAPTLFQRFSVYGSPTLAPESGRNLEFGLRYAAAGASFGAVIYRNSVDNLITFSVPGSCPSPVGCYASTKRARYEGLTLSGTRELGGVHLSAALDLQNPRDLDTGRQLARRAREHAKFGADTRWAGWLLGADLQLSGRRYDDAANAKPLGGYGVLALHASTRVARDWTLLARVDNLADKRYELAQTYLTAGRSFYAGLRWAPQ